ncbi:MAG: chemotaxis protein CheW [Steroidobacteraceae bacterium]
MSRLTKYMPAVVGYRERLATLQGAWDSLALLSHLSDDGTNLSNTREAFESLAADLVTHLETETHRKALLEARARAQVVIDILVRNLFERTADVGFLAADDAIRSYASNALASRSSDNARGADTDAAAATLSSDTRTMQRRLAEYVAKYSVYQNVILLSPTGEVLLQLEGGSAPTVSRDPLISTTIATDGYVETFRCSDLVPDGRRALIYSHRVISDRQTLGVLCLCFRLEDECESIFARLRSEADWTVLSLLDARGEVIFSSDAWQLPLGAKLSGAGDASGNILRFAGREFLAVTCKAQPYQGYGGPAWRGHVMIPLERAFEAHAGGEQPTCAAEVLADLRSTASKFSAALREIPRKADAVQRDLNRSVWNGSVRLSLGDGSNGTFAKALLREISNMGRKTKEVFERSIEELHETVVSAVMHDSRFLASLAIELLARNFYERANDCRWWALNATLSGHLAGAPDCGAEAANRVLRHINSLYTVYHAIVLFDSQRQVVATSRPDQEEMLGAVIEDAWAADTLALSGTQAYSVSQFRPSPLYGGRPTLIFAAAVRSAEGRCVGGIAVVFDTAPQLAAMLQDAIPKDEGGEAQAGCIALFLDRELNILACTDPVVDTTKLGWVREIAHAGDARIVRLGNEYHSVGAKRDAGYREFEGLGGYAVVLMPIGTVAQQGAGRAALTHRPAARQEHGKQDGVEFATFAVGENWYALPASNVIEAVDARSLQSLPKTQAWCAGYLMFGDEPIVIADTARLLGTTYIDRPRMVVAIRAPGQKRPFGLLVESLGDIPEVPRDRLLPINGLRAESASALVEQAIDGADARDPLIMVLNAARLAALLRGESIEELAA